MRGNAEYVKIFNFDKFLNYIDSLLAINHVTN